MTRRFATMSQIVADNTSDRREQQERHEFRDRQVAGRVVMVDRRCPYDPADAVVMLLVATEAGSLVRAPLTGVEVKGLLEFARAEGEPIGIAAAELLRLRERVAELERLRPLRRPAKVLARALDLLMQRPVVTRIDMAQALYGVSHRKATIRLQSVIHDARLRVEAAGGRLEAIYRVGWRLEADADTRAKLAAHIAEELA